MRGDEVGGIAFRFEGVLAAAETLLRAQGGDNDFLTDAASKRLAESLDAWAMDRFPQLRGKRGGVRRVIHCEECGRLSQHAAYGKCESCYQRRRRRNERRAA